MNFMVCEIYPIKLFLNMYFWALLIFLILVHFLPHSTSAILTLFPFLNIPKQLLRWNMVFSLPAMFLPWLFPCPCVVIPFSAPLLSL